MFTILFSKYTSAQSMYIDFPFVALLSSNLEFLIVLFSLAMMVIGGAVAFLGILFSKPEYIVEK